jgi:DNA-binding NarL/FixJ family response regulator
MSLLNTTKITIAIVDDNDSYRDALLYYFNQLDDVEVLFEATNGLQLKKKLNEVQPHVILLDMEMPHLSGMETLQLLRSQYPSIKFIMLTMFTEEALINAFLENGANSYLNKSATGREIYTAILNCYYDDFWMNNWIENALISQVKKRIE